jgi:hypothetical protein
MPIWYETEAELDRAVADVAALSPQTRRLLAKAVETQGYTVGKISKSIDLLSEIGFLYIRNTSNYDGSATVTPTLWGEEALDVYEERKNNK